MATRQSGLRIQPPPALAPTGSSLPLSASFADAQGEPIELEIAALPPPDQGTASTGVLADITTDLAQFPTPEVAPDLAAGLRWPTRCWPGSWAIASRALERMGKSVGATETTCGSYSSVMPSI